MRPRPLVAAAAASLVFAVSWGSEPAFPSAAQPARVTPSGDVVPENLLRIELQFARPLSHPLQTANVRLLHADASPIRDALLDLSLLSEDGRAATLLLDPARVKTGLGANRVLGRALHAGDEVVLVVDDPQLPGPVRKQWRVGAAATSALDPAGWDLETPRARTRDPLVLRTDAILTASDPMRIAVRGPDGERVDGLASLTDGETAWRFRPARPWVPGPYSLVLHPAPGGCRRQSPMRPVRGAGPERRPVPPALSGCSSCAESASAQLASASGISRSRPRR